jgi:asparagine synthase (glutamine-hydrolysing)
MIGTRGVANIWGAVDFSSQPNIPWLSDVSLALGFPPQPISGCVLGCISEGLDTCSGDCEYPANHSVSGDLQLHNRAELRALLGFGKQADEWDDGQLVLAAYEKWGEECCRYLIGEFAFAIWDDRNRRLFCCRDHLGTRPFLYWHNGSRFLFASDVRTILACPGVPRELNRRKLAGMALFDGHHFYSDETFHAGILSLPSGFSLVVDARGAHKRMYWEPEIRPELVPAKPEEAIEALRHLLFQAVECRIPENSQATVELSGGLDSSAITAIAARFLERKGRTLLAVSGVLPDNVTVSQRHRPDEREYIDEFRSWPNVRIEYVTALGRGPFDGIEDPTGFYATPLRTSRFFLQEELHQRAFSLDAHSVLRGLSGELGPTNSGKRYYLELAAKCHWSTLARELVLLRKVRGVRPFRFLAAQLFDLLGPPPWRHKPTPQVLFTESFQENSKVWRRERCARPDQRQHQLTVLRNFQRGHAAWWARSNEHPIRISQPWLDKRVVEYCLSAPPTLKVKNGYHRNLMRESMDGVLPKRIQWRTSKTPFSPDYSARFNAQLGRARDVVEAISPRDPVREILDMDRLAGLLRPVDPQTAGPIERDSIPATMYVLCFLRQFSDYRP